MEAKKIAFIKRVFNNDLTQSDKDSFLYKGLKKQGKKTPLKYPDLGADFLHQMDVLSLPTDKGFKFLLVCVDVGTGRVALEPLKKMGDVLEATKRIYKRMKIPTRLNVDNGSEFKGAFLKYMKSQNVSIKNSIPYRHRAVGHAERLNSTVSKIIFHLQYMEEQKTGWTEQNTEWVKYIPIIEKAINKRRVDNPKKVPKKDYIQKRKETEILQPGTEILLYLETPRDQISGKPLVARNSSKFRETDIRLERTPRKIVDWFIFPDQKHIAYIITHPKLHKKEWRKHLYTRSDFILAK